MKTNISKVIQFTSYPGNGRYLTRKTYVYYTSGKRREYGTFDNLPLTVVEYILNAVVNVTYTKGYNATATGYGKEYPVKREVYTLEDNAI